MDEMTALERQLAAELHELMGPVRPVDAAAVVGAVVAADRARAGGPNAFGVLRFVGAAVIVALFGGFLLLALLATQPEVDLAPAASPSPVVSHFSDPVGDIQRSIGVRPVDEPHGDEADIVAVTSSTTAEDVVLEVELLDDWVLAESTLWFSLFPDPVATYQRDGPLPATHYCAEGVAAWLKIEVNERVAPAETEAPPTPGGTSPAPPLQWPFGAWVYSANTVAFTDIIEQHLPYEVSGRRLGITIPLALLGDPETLSLGQMRAFGPGDHELEGDYFPNDQSTCVPIPLIGQTRHP